MEGERRSWSEVEVFGSCSEEKGRGRGHPPFMNLPVFPQRSFQVEVSWGSGLS